MNTRLSISSSCSSPPLVALLVLYRLEDKAIRKNPSLDVPQITLSAWKQAVRQALTCCRYLIASPSTIDDLCFFLQQQRCVKIEGSYVSSLSLEIGYARSDPRYSQVASNGVCIRRAAFSGLNNA